MPDIKISEQQAEALKTVLDRVLGDLSVEIADTDRKAFRDELKQHRDALKEVREKL